MIVFPGMLIDAARKAGIKVPSDPDNYDHKEYPHFDIFCKVQLCRPVRWGDHYANAKVVARIKDKNIETITIDDLIADGLEYQA